MEGASGSDVGGVSLLLERNGSDTSELGDVGDIPIKTGVNTHTRSFAHVFVRV